VNVTQIEETVKKLVLDVLNSSVDKDQFIYELMAAYGHRKTTVSRIKSGERNLAKVAGEVRAKRHIYFKHSGSNKVFSDIDDMKKEPSVAREKIRFIIATDFNQFVAIDTRTNDTLDIKFSELGKHFDFFLPWAGMEKAVYQGDNPADVKAAEKMARLFDLIKADNFSEENKNDTASLHNLNVFLTRLLFCFFAEDTGIFTDNQFSAELESHTKADGSDVDSYLNRLFEVLNTSKENRHDLPDYLAKFEYVNGRLFADDIASPKFSSKSRRMLIECGSELDWSDINPDIFGSMIQAVVHPDQRGGMGMHYTSVINIMKVIEPLFLDDLYAELENIAENIDPKLKPSRLRKLHHRIANIKIFDPACGSGNFLIIAFKELRKLEMEVIKQLQEFKKDDYQNDFFDEVGLDSSFSRIKLSQFYGIELDDFAHEVAILSLWLAEHQMNVEFKAEFGDCEPALPLKQSGNIFSGNAAREDWELICPINQDSEVIILGNPPYLGTRNQKAHHKADIDHVFPHNPKRRKLDYIAIWFYLASQYIQNGKSKFGFVTTNSINQGEQISILWPSILDKNNRILFAYKEFIWTNNAKKQAGVTVSIIGIGKSKEHSLIYEKDRVLRVKNINPFLLPGPFVNISAKSQAISSLPEMVRGNYTGCCLALSLSEVEKDDLINAHPESEQYIKKYVGSSELIKSLKRYCLWIPDEKLSQALEIPEIKRRVNLVREERLKSSDEGQNKIAWKSHQYREFNATQTSSIVIPVVSSYRRTYIPCGVVGKDSIVPNSSQVIYDCEPYVLAILMSKMHMAWVRLLAGKLRSDLRYSSSLCYNTFPLPPLNSATKNIIQNSAINILAEREKYPNLTLAELYDFKTMPESLKKVHIHNDILIDSIFTDVPLIDDIQRLEVLFENYKNMIGSQDA